MGLPGEELTQVEVKQLTEANTLLDRSVIAFTQGRGLENPDHGDKLDVWKTPAIKRLLEDSLIKTVHFDQCRFGAETTYVGLLLAGFVRGQQPEVRPPTERLCVPQWEGVPGFA